MSITKLTYTLLNFLQLFMFSHLHIIHCAKILI